MQFKTNWRLRPYKSFTIKLIRDIVYERARCSKFSTYKPRNTLIRSKQEIKTYNKGWVISVI